MLGINPGRLRERLDFYSLARIADGSGGFSQKRDFFEFATYGARTTLRAVKGIESGQLVHIVPYMFTIRYNRDRVPQIDWLIKYKGNDYLITSINPPDEYEHLITLNAVRS